MQAHQYFSDAGEAEAFMKEKEALAGNADYGKDEDSAEALLKRHEAFIGDLEGFKNGAKYQVAGHLLAAAQHGQRVKVRQQNHAIPLSREKIKNN